MQLLDENSNLEQFLTSIKGKKITIVTAFASGTESLIQTLLENNNQLELIIGTINAFSSPKLIEFCANCENKNISTLVDFRYQNSIHWKLYLVAPNLVIVGSANFTTTGIQLTRDTCVVIRNKELFDTYAEKVTALKKTDGVINVKDSRSFKIKLKKYCQMHDRCQAGMARTKQYATLTQWLEDDTNQSIPLLIWETEHSSETIKKAEELLGQYEDNVFLRDFFTCECGKTDLPYTAGDVVLCVKNNGKYLNFFTFDRIVYDVGEGKHYIYSYRKSRYLSPFNLNQEEKKKLKTLIPEILEKEEVVIERSLLESLVS